MAEEEISAIITKLTSKASKPADVKIAAKELCSFISENGVKNMVYYQIIENLVSAANYQEAPSARFIPSLIVETEHSLHYQPLQRLSGNPLNLS